MYCGNCRKYKSQSCPGCAENEKATWCKTRTCCQTSGYTTCAECTRYGSPEDCGYIVNFFSGIFSFFFRSDRPASLAYISRHGAVKYVALMEELKAMCIKRGQKF